MRPDFARAVAILVFLFAGHAAVANWRACTVTQTGHLSRSEQPGNEPAVKVAAARATCTTPNNASCLIYGSIPPGPTASDCGPAFACSTPRGQPWSQYIGTLLTASYYNDGILLDQYQRQGGSSGNETIFEVLWRDTTLQSKSIRTLSLSRYFGSPFGWMVARTGWDENAVIAEMKINEYNFVNHQHLDAGAFQVYHKGALHRLGPLPRRLIRRLW